MARNSADGLPFDFRTRRSRWDELKKNPEFTFDVAVIGGGIVGAGLLRELSLRGAGRVCLFEKNDFASGTSSASSKLIHAGLRYLEQVWIHLKSGRIKQALINFRFVWQASGERRRLGRLFPGLVRPKTFYFLLSKSDARFPFSVLTGVWAYYLMQVFQGQFFTPPCVYLRQAAMRAAFPGLDTSSIKAIFSFWDSETDDARLVIESLQEAHANGAQAFNYVELQSYERRDGKIWLTLVDKETGETARVSTKRLINATGAFVDDVRRMGNPNAPLLIDRVAGSHIDIYPAFADRSYYVSTPDGRLVFILRRQEDDLIYNRIGTTERPLAPNEPSDRPHATSAEIAYLKQVAKIYFPSVTIDENTIIKTDSGIRPLRAQSNLDTFNKSREHDIIDEDGVTHIVGVKLTDFRRVSEEVVDRLGVPRDRAGRPMTVDRAARVYPDQSMSEIIHDSMVLHWDDYFLRRRGAYPAVLAKTDPRELDELFQQMARELGWNEARIKEERAPTPGGKKA